MKKILSRLIEKENGTALILVSVAMLGLLAMTGLVIDGGSLYVTKSHLQKTANAAALSGAQKLIEGEIAVRGIVEEVLHFHKEQTSLQSISIQEEDLVRLSLEKKVDLSFASLLGMEQAPVQATASAEVGIMGQAKGAVPLGIDERFELELYEEYELKTDTSGVDHGWFGILALGGPGAATYYDNFMNGYQHEIRVGDIIETQTGNVAGKTRDAVKERIDNCPYTLETAIDKKCSRIILVPVYQAYDTSGGQIKKVMVKGFAYFYLTKPVSGKDTSVHGMFIKMTGPGKIDESAASRGAFSIRLTE
ncbi:pilus assembly protein TadG-related protein [Bacillus salitolerans]|uniref:Pilus assembly protein TadG-related protein n=1 Tax=Bacillus salitolerans TaxID=1437434 RepID=A0ABW4LJP7_9BACI